MSEPPPHTPATPGSRWRNLATTVAWDVTITMAGLAIVFLMGEQRLDDRLLVTPLGASEPQELSLQDVLQAGLGACILAIGLALLLDRLTPHPRKTFRLIGWGTVVGAGALAVLAADNAGAAVWLNVLHLAVAIPMLRGLASWLPAQNRSDVGPTYLPPSAGAGD